MSESVRPVTSMTPTNVEFNTSDGVTLRGWFVKPKDAATSSLPCLVMTHGWSYVKEMGLIAVAALLTSSLPISCLIYDHRSFGDSDTLPGQPRQEIIPPTQASDMRDAITYAQSRNDVNEDQIGLWGFSSSGGLSLYLGAVDRRIKAVIAVAPMVDGWKLVHRFLPPDALNTMLKDFESDRLARAAGERPKMIPVTSADSMASTSIPSRAVWDFVSRLDKIAPRWRNETTVRR
ncbi:hypothetical protein Q9189_004474 [Teloschistes chrysophthalmus]